MLHDSLIKLMKFIKYYILMDVDKFIIPGEIVGRMNPILMCVEIFLGVVALLLNLNLGVFMISIIL